MRLPRTAGPCRCAAALRGALCGASVLELVLPSFYPRPEMAAGAVFYELSPVMDALTVPKGQRVPTQTLG